MTTIWARIDTDLGEALTWLKNLLTTTAEAEVLALKPLAESAVAAVLADASSLLTPGGWVAALAAAALQLLPKLETTGLQVAGASILTALGGALANAQVNAGATANPAPITAVVPPVS